MYGLAYYGAQVHFSPFVSTRSVFINPLQKIVLWPLKYIFADMSTVHVGTAAVIKQAGLLPSPAIATQVQFVSSQFSLPEAQHAT